MKCSFYYLQIVSCHIYKLYANRFKQHFLKLLLINQQIMMIMYTHYRKHRQFTLNGHMFSTTRASWSNHHNMIA